MTLFAISPLLAQVADTTAAAAAAATAHPAQTEVHISVFQMILKGGWVMVPILLLLALTVYLALYKFMSIRKFGHVDKTLLASVINSLNRGDIAGAQNLCRSNPTLLARILERGTMRIGSPMPEIENGMESAAKAASTFLDKNLGILASVATMAPMFGFLGTVIGMINVFTDIGAAQDNLSISTIANGMYVKMVTSAAGIIVGIIAHICNTYLNSMVDASLNRMEDAAAEFLDTLYKPSYEVRTP